MTQTDHREHSAELGGRQRSFLILSSLTRPPADEIASPCNPRYISQQDSRAVGQPVDRRKKENILVAVSSIRDAADKPRTPDQWECSYQSTDQSQLRAINVSLSRLSRRESLKDHSVAARGAEPPCPPPRKAWIYALSSVEEEAEVRQSPRRHQKKRAVGVQAASQAGARMLPKRHRQAKSPQQLSNEATVVAPATRASARPREYRCGAKYFVSLFGCLCNESCASLTTAYWCKT